MCALGQRVEPSAPVVSPLPPLVPAVMLAFDWAGLCVPVARAVPRAEFFSGAMPACHT